MIVLIRHPDYSAVRLTTTPTAVHLKLDCYETFSLELSVQRHAFFNGDPVSEPQGGEVETRVVPDADVVNVAVFGVEPGDVDQRESQGFGWALWFSKLD